MRKRRASPLGSNYWDSSSTGLLGRRFECPMWSDLGPKPHGLGSPLLATSGRSAHRELRRLHPQHRTFGRGNAPTRETPAPRTKTGVSLYGDSQRKPPPRLS